MSLREQSIDGCFPKFVFQFFVAQGLVEKNKNNFAFLTWACAAGFNNNNKNNNNNTNNMKFNAIKFELLRYGKEQEIKSATTYLSYDESNIDDLEVVQRSRHNDE